MSKGKAGTWISYVILTVGLLNLAVLDAAAALSVNALSNPNVAQQTAVIAAYYKAPLSFELNRGQTDAQVKFLSRGSGYSLFLTPKEAVLVLRTPEKGQERVKLGRSRTAKVKEAESIDTDHTDVLRMQLVGANSTPKVVGEEEQVGKSNYFSGKDPKNWRTSIPHYTRVRYEAVYPGIDLIYYGNQRRLEYDFIVAPEADPKAIRLSFKGSGKPRLDKKGNLVLETSGGKIIQHAPKVYQNRNGKRHIIDAHYEISGHQVGIHVAAYDVKKPLIIDPVLSYSTYLGGSEDESGNAIAVDKAGNAYVTGNSSSPDFPIVNALQPSNAGGRRDAFVVKLSPEGDALVYATYLGGSDDEFVRSISVDNAGSAYVIGSTLSTDFPTANPLQQNCVVNQSGFCFDAFVAKLSTTGGALEYSTYLGGSGLDEGSDIAVDHEGSAYLTGTTDSVDFPTANPLQPAIASGTEDGFVAKLNPSGDMLVYSTYLGGSNRDVPAGIAIAGSGHAYVVGGTLSIDFPTANALQADYGGGFGDAFVAKLSKSGDSLVYATYLGGSKADASGGTAGPSSLGGKIAVDDVGNAYVTGSTASTDFPTTTGAFQTDFGGLSTGTLFPGDAFVVKLNAEGSAFMYATYLGGSEDEQGSAIAVDSNGNAYLIGITRSTDFPTANPLQSTCAISQSGFCDDAFVAKISREGNALLYATYFGGTSLEGGLDIAVSSTGVTYVTGSTSSTNFPTNRPLQPTCAIDEFGECNDNAFVAKISPQTTDHFLCYRTRTTKKTANFNPVKGIELTDQFESKYFDINRLQNLCNPADKNDEGIADPTMHLVGYQTKRMKGEPRHKWQRKIRVANQFGELFVDTIKPSQLLVPSSKDLEKPVEVPDPTKLTLNHFKCYDVRITPQTPALPEDLKIVVTDQFNEAKRYRVLSPTHLCNPVDKNGEGIKNPDAHLMCYAISPAPGEPRHQRVRGIHLNNQLGPAQVDAVRGAERICVPTTQQRR